uniref:Uncharacterized protein n=1 Tax=Anguilla anguilla TaxID=7936 RepID=A0A0E9UET0_ANGAN
MQFYVVIVLFNNFYFILKDLECT